MKTKLHYFFILLVLLAGVHQVRAQGTTAFTYQGQLHDNGTNANGAYTMIFALYDASTNGNLLTTPITNSPTLANGLFSANLDFGVGVFTGAARWLDITITNGGVTQTLSPRVQVLPAPYALYAANANIAASAATVVSGIRLTNAFLTNSILSGDLITNSTIGNTTITNSLFSGNGAGLTNILHQLIIPVTANYVVSTNDLIAMLSSNVIYSIQSTPYNTFPLVFTFPTPPTQTVQFTLLLEGTNAITLANPNGTTFVVSSGSGLANSNSFSMSGYAGKSETWDNPNGTTWQMTASSLTLQEEQNIAAGYVGVTNQNGVGLTNIPAVGITGLTNFINNTVIYKNVVQEATTTNLPSDSYNNGTGTLSGPNASGQLTVDTITVQVGDNVLVKNESNGAANGIYVCTLNTSNTGYSLTRRTDFNNLNTVTNIAQGDTVTVIQGAINTNTTWVLITGGPIILGTTPLTFAQTVVKTLNGLTGNVTLAAGTNVSLFTNGNFLTISASVPFIQLFRNTSTTFTVPTNVTRIMVEMWGAGGGGGLGYNNPASGNGIGGGGGAGSYSLGVFTVTPGASYTVTAPPSVNGGQNGGSSSFIGGSISMTAAGGLAGGNATNTGNGNGGSGGAASGGVINSSGGSGDGNGNGGGVWRGAGVALQSGNGSQGPGGGGAGAGPSGSGQGGNSGAVIIYY